MSVVDHEEAELIMSLHDSGMSFEDIAFKVGRTGPTISKVVKRFSPTHKLATRYIKANALVLAERIVKLADVDQATDILTRPNVGVLQPLAKNVEEGRGLFISVSHNSLGAIDTSVTVIDTTAVKKDGNDGDSSNGQVTPQRSSGVQEVNEPPRTLGPRPQEGSERETGRNLREHSGDAQGVGQEREQPSAIRERRQLSRPNRLPQRVKIRPATMPFAKPHSRPLVLDTQKRSNVNLRYDVVEPDA